MNEGTTDEQVDPIAGNWIKAIRKMPGGEAATVDVLWPVAITNSGEIDFHFVVTFPSFGDLGQILGCQQR